MTNSKIEQKYVRHLRELFKYSLYKVYPPSQYLYQGSIINIQTIFQTQGQNNLMKSVSLALFSTIEYHEKIQHQCKKHIKFLIESKLLSKKLESFIQNERWVADYFTNPSLKCFERLNLELLSLIFKTKICIYTISQENQYLKASIYNNGFDVNLISLYQPDSKHYDAIRMKNSPQTPQIDQQLVQEIIGEIKEQPKEIFSKDQLSNNNNYHSGITESPQVSGQNRLSFHRKHKKSLSDTFNPFQVRIPNDFLDLFKVSNDYSNNTQFLSTIAHHTSSGSNQNNHFINNNLHDDTTQIKQTNSNRIQYQNHIEEIDELLQTGINLNNQPVSSFNHKTNENNSSTQSYNSVHQFQNTESTQHQKNGQSQNLQLSNADVYDKENQSAKQINKINQMNGHYQNNLSNKLQSQNNVNMFGAHNKNNGQLNQKFDNNQNYNSQNSNNQMINKQTGQIINYDENIGFNSQNSNNNSVSSDSQNSNLSFNSNQNQNFNGKLDNKLQDQQNQMNIQGQQTNQLQNSQQSQSASSTLDFFQNNQMLNNPTTNNNQTLLAGGAPNLLQQLNPQFMPSPASINLLLPNFDQLQNQSKTQLNKSVSYTQSNSQVHQQQQPQQQHQQQQQQHQQSQHQQQLQQQPQLTNSVSTNNNNMQINESLRRYMGSLKFFDENKNYGFIVMDDDNRDIFVHYDDLQKAGITKEFLKSSKQGNVIRFSFSCMQYVGKYKQSKKAVELQVMPYNPALSALRRHFQFCYISSTSNNTSNINNNNISPIVNKSNNINTPI